MTTTITQAQLEAYLIRMGWIGAPRSDAKLAIDEIEHRHWALPLDDGSTVWRLRWVSADCFPHPNAWRDTVNGVVNRLAAIEQRSSDAICKDILGGHSPKPMLGIKPDPKGLNENAFQMTDPFVRIRIGDTDDKLSIRVVEGKAIVQFHPGDEIVDGGTGKGWTKIARLSGE